MAKERDANPAGMAEKAGKTHGFKDGHPAELPVMHWFQQAPEGLVLFLVFYTQACRWNLCTGCNLPSVSSSRHVSFDKIMAQIDHVFALPEVRARLGSIRKVILSNNGSVLDEATFSSTALMYFISQCNLLLPNLACVSMETRTEYVDLAELEFLSRALAEGPTPTQLELAVGFEAFDDAIRNKHFKKGMSLRAFEALVEKMAPHGHRLKTYFMLKPVPGMDDAEAAADIHRAIDYLEQVSRTHGVAINMHLNPTYVAQGTPLETAFREGRYEPPGLGQLARAARHAAGKEISIFLGLSDEGLAAPGGSFRKPGDGALVELLEEFNRTQDHGLLDAVLAGGRDGE